MVVQCDYIQRPAHRCPSCISALCGWPGYPPVPKGKRVRWCMHHHKCMSVSTMFVSTLSQIWSASGNKTISFSLLRRSLFPSFSNRSVSFSVFFWCQTPKTLAPRLSKSGATVVILWFESGVVIPWFRVRNSTCNRTIFYRPSPKSKWQSDFRNKRPVCDTRWWW